MVFKPKQLDPNATKVFSENEVGTLLESLDSKIDLILESQEAMSADIKTIKAGFRELTTRVDRTEIRLDVIEAR